MKLIKIGNRYINPEKASVVYRRITVIGNREIQNTIVIVGGGDEEYAMTGEDIEFVVEKITQEGGDK